jgi:hypothetical protein
VSSEKAREKAAPAVDRPAAVSRLYDEAGALLYVGSSFDPEERCKGHREKPWWARRSFIGWFLGLRGWRPPPGGAAAERERSQASSYRGTEGPGTIPARAQRAGKSPGLISLLSSAG